MAEPGASSRTSGGATPIPQDEAGGDVPNHATKDAEPAMASEAELDMHRKWNVAFRDLSGGPDDGNGDGGRRKAYEEKREAEEVRRLAQEALRRREEAERAAASAADPQDAGSEGLDADPVDDAHRDAVAQTLREALGVVPAPVRRAFAPHLVQLDYRAGSPHAAFSVKLTFPRGFPSASAAAEVQSRSLHDGVLRKLAQGCQAACDAAHRRAEALASYDAADAPSDEGKGPSNPIAAVHGFCAHFLSRHRLLAAFPEVVRIKELLAEPDSEGSALGGVDEKRGTLLLRLKCGGYRADVRLTAAPSSGGTHFASPDAPGPMAAQGWLQEYPCGEVGVALAEGGKGGGEGTNLPAALAETFLTLAHAKVRRKDATPPPEVGKGMDGGIGAPPAAAPPASRKKVHPKRQIHQTAASAARERALLMEQEERKQRQAVEAAAKREEAAWRGPDARLLEVVRFLLVDCLQAVVRGRCGQCGKGLLPGDPALVRKVPKKMALVRLRCGHFYHQACLTKYVNTPPFRAKCHTCGQKIEDHGVEQSSKLEARWAAQQAREREIADCADLF